MWDCTSDHLVFYIRQFTGGTHNVNSGVVQYDNDSEFLNISGAETGSSPVSRE